MANTTVYPYGTNGELPSSIGIINDLVTGGVDKALSAEMGKEIGEEIFPEVLTDKDISGLTQTKLIINASYNSWSSGGGYSVMMPVNPGEHYRLVRGNEGNINFAVMTTNVYGANGSDVTTYATGYTNRVVVTTELSPYDLTIPSDGHYMYIRLNDSGGNNMKPAHVYLVEEGTLSDVLNDRIDSCEESISELEEEVRNSGQKKIEDSITGNGNTSVLYYFDAKPGDYIHVYFPNGNWSTTSSRDDYNKFGFGWRDSNDVLNYTEAVFTEEPWPIPSYGYDIYFSDDITDMKDAYLLFRAASGLEVPFVLTWLSKYDMKDYFSDEMADTVEKVRKRQGNQTATLMICTDIHYRSTRESYRPFAPYSVHGMGLVMKEFARRVRIDNVVCLGDIIDGLFTAARGKLDARDLARVFSGIGVPLLYAVGNHDDNRYWNKQGGDRIFTADEIYAEFIQQVDERTTVEGAMHGCNYYRDLDRLGLRFIVLMSINFSGQYYFTTDTQNFLTATFNSMPSGYKAVIFTHTPLLQTHNYSTSTTINGGTAVSNIIANNLDKFLVLIDGHTHFDDQWMSPFVEINIGATKVYNLESGLSDAAPEGAYFCERAAGDAREQLWDVVVIDKVNSLLSCIRFGAGVDRYVHLTPVEVAVGGTTTLTPSVLTAASWETRTSEASSITIASGVVTVDAGATTGARLTAICKDASDNMEFWTIKVI